MPKHRILIAEDDDTSRRQLERLLERLGYEIVCASDGQEAWRVLASPEPPSVALLDWNMPKIDGVELCRRVKQLGREETPHIIMVTARDDIDDVVEALDAGASDYIKKPYVGSELKARIEVGLRIVELQSSLLARIAQMEHSEKALKQSEERYAAAQRAADIGTWEWEIASGRVEMSKHLEPMWGFGPGEFNGSLEAMLARVSDTDVEKLRWWLELKRSGADEGALDCRLRLPDRTQRWISLSGEPRRDPPGHIAGVLGVCQDVSERVRLAEKLRQYQKMESIGRLAGGVAHDFNNLLSPILGYTEMLLDDMAELDPRYNQLQEVYKAADRAKDLTRQLLAFSRKQVLHVHTLSLDETIENFGRILRRTIREDVDIRVDLGAEDAFIDADASQVEQVLMNLAVNAQDAMPEGGLLTIATRAVELDNVQQGYDEEIPPGRYVELSISDTGCGMDTETRAQLFEPFYTTKPAGEGTGLGLSTVHGVVTQHGARICVFSEPNQGTAFKIYFPVSRSALSAKDKTSWYEEKRGEETVLLVEDDAMVRELAESVLLRSGYEVVAAESPAEALEKVARLEGPIDLLLTDVVMPGMNGRMLHRKLMETRRDLPALFMSGYAHDTMAHKGVLEGNVHFISKPFSIKSLAAKVREVLDQS